MELIQTIKQFGVRAQDHLPASTSSAFKQSCYTAAGCLLIGNPLVTSAVIGVTSAVAHQYLQESPEKSEASKLSLRSWIEPHLLPIKSHALSLAVGVIAARAMGLRLSLYLLPALLQALVAYPLLLLLLGSKGGALLSKAGSLLLSHGSNLLAKLKENLEGMVEPMKKLASRLKQPSKAEAEKAKAREEMLRKSRAIQRLKQRPALPKPRNAFTRFLSNEAVQNLAAKGFDAVAAHPHAAAGIAQFMLTRVPTITINRIVSASEYFTKAERVGKLAQASKVAPRAANLLEKGKLVQRSDSLKRAALRVGTRLINGGLGQKLLRLAKVVVKK